MVQGTGHGQVMCSYKKVVCIPLGTGQIVSPGGPDRLSLGAQAVSPGGHDRLCLSRDRVVSP